MLSSQFTVSPCLMNCHLPQVISISSLKMTLLIHELFMQCHCYRTCLPVLSLNVTYTLLFYLSLFSLLSLNLQYGDSLCFICQIPCSFSFAYIIPKNSSKPVSFLWQVSDPTPNVQVGGPSFMSCLGLLSFYICSYSLYLGAFLYIWNLRTYHTRTLLTWRHIWYSP
jgi:hypothetical protein